MKKQLFIALFFAVLTGITYQAQGMEKKQNIILTQEEFDALKKQLLNGLDKLDTALKKFDQSNSNNNRAIKDSLPSIEQTANQFNALGKKKPTYSISSINPFYAFKGTLFSIITGVSGYTLIKMIKNSKPIMENSKGWFAIAGFGLGAFYTYKNFSKIFKLAPKK